MHLLRIKARFGWGTIYYCNSRYYTLMICWFRDWIQLAKGYFNSEIALHVLSCLLYQLVTLYILCCRENQAFWCRSRARGPTITELAGYIHRTQWGKSGCPHNQIPAFAWVRWLLSKCLSYDLSTFLFFFSFHFWFTQFLFPLISLASHSAQFLWWNRSVFIIFEP